jgi:hypothetical protein
MWQSAPLPVSLSAQPEDVCVLTLKRACHQRTTPYRQVSNGRLRSIALSCAITAVSTIEPVVGLPSVSQPSLLSAHRWKAVGFNVALGSTYAIVHRQDTVRSFMTCRR